MRSLPDKCSGRKTISIAIRPRIGSGSTLICAIRPVAPFFVWRVPPSHQERRSAHATFPRKVTEQRIDSFLQEAFSFCPIHSVTAAILTLEVRGCFNLLRRDSGHRSTPLEEKFNSSLHCPVSPDRLGSWRKPESPRNRLKGLLPSRLRIDARRKKILKCRQTELYRMISHECKATCDLRSLRAAPDQCVSP